MMSDFDSPRGVPEFVVREIHPWRTKLIKKDGKLAKSPANIVTILREHPDWKDVLVYDMFAERVVMTKPPPWDDLDKPLEHSPIWSDADTGRLQTWLFRHERVEFGRDKCETAILIAAEARAVHPVREYLISLEWDGVNRLETMLCTYFGTLDTPYTRGVSLRWPISAVARVMRPGCQADCTIVLEDPLQGAGKSTALEALAGDGSGWFADTSVEVGNKDSYQNLRGVWIYELGELDSVRKAETTRVKNFLSARSDRYRPSFGRRAVDFKRQNIFAGTTNETHYLTDVENRRYWPVRVMKAMMLPELRRDRDQLWAEAYARFARGEKWHVDNSDFHLLCKSEQSDRMATDPWEVPIMIWLKSPRTVSENAPFDLGAGATSTDVLVHCLHKSFADIDRGDEMRVAYVLRKIGWTVHKRVMSQGIRAYRYFTPELFAQWVANNQADE